MKVTILSISPGRGAAEKLTRVLTEHGGCEVRTFIRGLWYERGRTDFCLPFYRLPYAEDRKPQPISFPGRNALDEALDWCDVVHCMHLTSLRSPEVQRPDLLGKKRVIYHRFTIVPEGNLLLGKWKREDFRHLTVMYCAAGWGRFTSPGDPPHVIVRDTFMIDDEIYNPVSVQERIRSGFYCTMKRGDKTKKAGIHRGYKDMVLVLKRAGVNAETAKYLPFQLSMERRKKHWFGIDELFTPILHLTPYEYAACGVPCVTKWDKESEKEFHRGISTADVPFILSSIEQIHLTTRDILSWTDDLMYIKSSQLRQWMEENMHPKVVAKQYLDLYAADPEVTEIPPCRAEKN